MAGANLAFGARAFCLCYGCCAAAWHWVWLSKSYAAAFTFRFPQAAKFSQDRYYTNTHYARVGGLPSRELKALELEFLARIHYTLWADVEVIGVYESWKRAARLLRAPSRQDVMRSVACWSLVPYEVCLGFDAEVCFRFPCARNVH